MIIRKSASLALLGLAIATLNAPALYAVWLSFSPDSYLSPPTNRWSLRWYEAFVADARWTRALTNSLLIATSSSLVSVLAAGAAVIAARRRSNFAKRLIGLMMMTPMGLPPVALALGAIPMLSVTGLANSPVSLVMLHAVLGMPIAWLLLDIRLDQSHEPFESVALGLGASEIQAFMRITLPLVRWPLLMAMASVFLLSINESIVSVLLSHPSTETLPAIIWPQLRQTPSPLIAVASSVMNLLAIMVGAIWLVYLRVRPKW